MKKALITGITGQDGSYLTELLLKKGYEVVGLKRRTSNEGYGNVVHLLNDIKIIEGDLLDQSSLNYIVKETKPDEVYHLAAQSHVGTSFTQPLYTADCTGLGFNVQKTGGYELEHAYTNDPNSAKVFYLLLQIAHLLAQLLYKATLLKRDFLDGLGSAKNLAFRLLEAWRNVRMDQTDITALLQKRFQIRFDSS